MLFSKVDSQNLANLVNNTARIANALEQIATVVLKNDGKEFIPNKEQALADAKVVMHETNVEEIADEEFAQERNRIIQSLQEREKAGGTSFFIEDTLTAEELEYIQE